MRTFRSSRRSFLARRQRSSQEKQLARLLRLEPLEARCLLNSDWTNPAYQRDVNNDGQVTQQDALVGINQLNSRTLIDIEGSLADRDQNPNSPYYDTSGDSKLAPGDILLIINAMIGDVTGPTINASLMFDTAPGGTNSDGLTKDARISGTAVDDFVRGTGVQSLEVSVNGGPFERISGWTRTGEFMFDPQLTSDGLHTIEFRANDARFNFGPIATVTLTLDTTPPATPTSLALDPASDRGPSNSDRVTNESQPTMTGDADTGSTVLVLADGVQVGSTIATSPWSVATDLLTDGNRIMTAVAVDAAGNSSPPSSALAITIDTQAPAPQGRLLTGTQRRTFYSFDVMYNDTMSPSAFETSTYDLRVRGGANDGTVIPLTQATSFPPGQVFLEVANNLADQDYRFSLPPTLTDLAGNPVTTTIFDFTLADPAGITEISPAHGATSVGVTRETIIRFDEAIDPATVTADALRVIAKGELVPGRIVVSSTERFVTYFYDSALPPSTEVRVEIDGSKIMGRDGRALDADNNDIPGGMAQADFTTLSLTRIPGTEKFGYVYDAANRIPQEQMPIIIPSGDPHFDPMGTGDHSMHFERAQFLPGSGTNAGNPRQFVNKVSSFIDASTVYGSDEFRATALRRLDGSGEMKTSPGDHLPLNNIETFPNGVLMNDNSGPFPSDQLPVAGDTRVAEVPMLTALHTLFVREHNRYARLVKAANPRWSEDQIYEAARRWVGALIQHITYQEFLPALVGANPLPAYNGYNPNVDPGISPLFSTAALRLGHTLQSSSIQRLDASGQSLPGGPLVIRNAFFNPNPLRDDGLDAYLRGMVAGRAQAVDLQVIDDLRNFLFGPPGAGGLDLVSMNIQRGRDMGLPHYNQARVDFGLPAVTSFAEITSNATVAAALQTVYGDVNKIDIWIGGLAEDHVAGGTVGPLFAAIITDQFQRSRDGDRFWHENSQLTDSALMELRATTLADVIARNSGVTGLPANIFTMGTIHAGPGEGGGAHAGGELEVRRHDGYGNNEQDEHLGEAHWPLVTNYTVSFADGISSPTGTDRPLARSISNALSAQSGNSVNAAGLTDMLVSWGQFLDHDMDLTPPQPAQGTNIPVVGATIRVDAFPEANAVTDAHGFFELEDMPAPEFFVHIDGTTATNAPPGTMYPSVGKPFPAVPGKRVQLNMAGMPFNIYLPPMAMGDVQPLSDTETTNVGFGAAGKAELARMFPEIDPAAWDQVHVAFAPNGTVDDQGNAATQAVIIPVPPDRLPAPLPPDVNPLLVISIQAPGATNFDVPPATQFPNLDNLPLGSRPTLFSFDHDIGAWVPVGTMTVVSDGQGGTMLVSDPGTGIRAPGWHYTTPELNWGGSGGKPEGNQSSESPPDVIVRLFTSGDTDVLSFRFQPPPGPGKRVGEHSLPEGEPKRIVKISVRGALDAMYKNEGAQRIRDEEFTLLPGDAAVDRSATLRSLMEMQMAHNAGKPFLHDALYGAVIDVTETLILGDGTTIKSRKIFAPYYLLDQSDENPTDRQIKIPDTVVPGDVAFKRQIDLRYGSAPAAFFVFDGAAAADYSDAINGINFNPSAQGDRSARMDVEITIDGQKYRSSNGPPVLGKGQNIQTYFVHTNNIDAGDTTSIKAALAALGVEEHLRLLYAAADNAEEFTLTFGGSTTGLIRYDASAATIQAALVALGNILAGDVTVRLLQTENRQVPVAGGGMVPGVDTLFEVEFSGALQYTANTLTVNPGGGLQALSTSRRISKAETQLFDTEAERNDIADKVFQRATALFMDFSDGITVANAAGTNTIRINWLSTTQEGLLGDSQPGGVGDGIDEATKISDEIKDRAKYTPVVQNFRLDQAINPSLMTIAEAYVDSPLELRDLAAQANPTDALVNTLTKSAVHEGGHTLGGRHTWRTINGVVVETVVDGVNGVTDIMKQGIDFSGALEFREKLSANVLHVALNMGWTEEQGQRALTNYVKHYEARASGFDAAEEFPDIEGHLDDAPIEGAVLAMFVNDLLLFGNTLPLGAVLADGAGSTVSTVTLDLFNVGTSPLLIHSATAAGPAGVFSVAPIPPDTSIAPGGTLPVQVTFDPLLVGTANGTLTLDTNDDVLGQFVVELNGLGLSAQPTFQLALGNSGNNNLGGVARGTSRAVADMLVVTNLGVSPLTFTPQMVAGQVDFSLGALGGVTQQLASAQSLAIPLTFAPSALGLRPGLVSIATNDPNAPRVEQGVIGTGIPASGIGDGDFHWGNDFVRLRAGAATHQLRSDDAGFFQAGLGTNTAYELLVFDPVSGYLAMGAGTTGPSGAFNDLTSSLTFRADISADSDFDGLPDNSELAIGSSTNRRDTDGDGLTDFFEVQQGLDPLGGLRFPTGIIANLDLPGPANALAVAGDLVFVATGFHGLAIVNGRKFDNPILLGQLDLDGNATGVGVDERLGIAAVATGTGLALVDVSDPMLPQLLQTVKINASRVLVAEGVAFAGVGGDVSVVDLKTGEVLQTLDLASSFGSITGMARDGQYLYVYDDASSHLRVIDASVHAALHQTGSVFVPIASGDEGIHAANGIVWIAGSGLNSVDVSDPFNPVRIGQPSGAEFFAARRIALNGSGLGVLAPDFANRVEVYDLSDPTVVSNQVLAFPLTGNALDVAISRGLAYVGHSNKLAVLNYLPFDNAGEPPTVSISTPVSDGNANSPGIQVFEGTTIPIRVDAIDDVQVRHVELIVDGQVQQTDVSFPFDFTVTAPKRAGDASTSVVVRAVDTGGNVTNSQPLVVELVPDTFPPTITMLTPEDGSVRGSVFRTVRATFSEAMDQTTLTAENLRLMPEGSLDPLLPADIQIRDLGRTVQLIYDQLPAGENELVLRASALRDVAGNPLGAADVVRHFTVLESTALWINPDGGNWNDPANWDGNQLPGPNDDVLINVPANVTITHNTGDTQIRSLTSTNGFTLAGGTLEVTNFVEVQSTLTFSGGTLRNAKLSRRADLPAAIVAPAADVVFDNVRLDNNLRVSNAANLMLMNGLALNGTLTLLNQNFTTELTIEGSQTITGTGRIVLGGTANNGRSRIVTNDSETLTLDTGITVAAEVGALIGTSGAVVNRGKIQASAAGATTTLLGNSFVNQGTLDARAGTVIVSNVDNIVGGALGGGIWRVGPGSVLDVNANITTLSAHVTLDGVNARVLNGATNALAGVTTITEEGVLIVRDGNVLGTAADVSNQGTVSVGSNSRWNVTGAYSQADGASLNVGAAGINQVGLLAATGTATLDGVLNLEVASGVDLQLSTITPITYGARNGQFDNLTGLPAGVPFEEEYRPQRLFLHFGATFNVTGMQPYSSNFNDGTLGVGAIAHSNAIGRLMVTGSNQPRTGGQHLLMDAQPGTTGYASNELIFPLLISDTGPLMLSFYHKSFDTTPDSLPATFLGSITCDGVSMSVDGLHWFRILDLATATSSSYEQFSFDLRAIASSAGLQLADKLLIKFQQAGPGAAPGGGRAFDDIRVGADVIGPRVESISPAGPLLFSSTLAGLTVVFNEPIAAATAMDAANFRLVGDGADGQFGSSDDRLIAVTPGFDGDRTVQLAVAMPLANDNYRLTIKGTSTVTDVAGVPLLDGLDSATGFTVFSPESPTNDTRATATDTGLTDEGGAYSDRGAIGNNGSGGGDLDYYRLDGGSGQFVRVAAVPVPVPGLTGPLDLTVRLVDSAGTELATGNSPTSDEAGLSFSLPGNGTFFVEVSSAVGNVGIYDLGISLGGNVAGFPFAENFELGSPLASYWELRTTTTGRARVIDQFGPAGGHFHLVADTSTPVDPWILVHQDVRGRNAALAELGLIENVDYVTVTAGELAVMTVAEMQAFDVVFVAGAPNTDFGLTFDGNNNMQSDLLEALAGVGSTGRAVLTTLDVDMFGRGTGQFSTLLRQALDWVRAGQTTGLVALYDPSFQWQWTPWAASVNGMFTEEFGDDVAIVDSGHEVMTGLTDQGLSDGSPSYRQFLTTDIPDFSTLAVDGMDGTRRLAFALDGASETVPPEDRRPALNEAIVHVDLSGQGNVELRFDVRLFDLNEEFVDLPQMFGGSFNGTGVALSVDGATWFSLYRPGQLADEFTFHMDTQAIDLDEFAAMHNLTLGSDVAIKFQYFGFGPAPHRGIALDNVVLLTDKVGPVVGFLAPFDSLVHTRPAALAVGDIDGDMDDDFVTANSGFGGAVSVIESMAGGSVETRHVPMRAGSDVALADIDGDMDLDLLAIVSETGNPSPQLITMRNDGTGAFGSLATMNLPMGMNRLVVGDLNGDLRPDVIVAPVGGFGNQQMLMLMNNGTGGFLPGTPINLPVSPVALALGRLDADADLDLAVAGNLNGNGVIFTLLNTLDSGPFPFSPTASSGIANGPYGLALGDLNGDGLLDYAATSFNSAENGLVSVRYGAPGGSFAGGGFALQLDAAVFEVATARLDDDTTLDVVVIGQNQQGDGTAYGLINDGTGFFPTTRRFPVASGSIAVATGDVNGDSRDDVIVSTAGGVSGAPLSFDSEGVLTVLTNTGDATLVVGEIVPLNDLEIPQGRADISSLQIGFEETGRMDLATLTDAGNYRLVEAGLDGQFSAPDDPQSDDRVIMLDSPVVVSFGHENINVMLGIAGSELPLPAGKYRFTAKGTSTIRDAEGNPLNDLDGDGTGADYVRDLVILENGPVLVSTLPDFDAGRQFDQIQLQFSEELDADTFTLDDITNFNGPRGMITPTSVSVSGSVATVLFPLQTESGFYSLTIGPNIADLSGQLMNQNFNLTFGEVPGDQLSRTMRVGNTLFDGDNFTYALANDTGAIANGGRGALLSRDQRFGAYSDAYRLAVGGQQYAGLTTPTTVEDAGRTIVFPAKTLADLEVHREVYVPESGGSFARIIDVLRNPTGAPVMVPVIISGSLTGLPPVLVTGSSSGDATLTLADNWFATDDAIDGFFATEVAHVMQDGQGLAKVVEVTYDPAVQQFQWKFDVTVGAGETVRLLTFAVQAGNRAAATAEAAALQALPARATANLTAEELASIVNFLVASPLRLEAASYDASSAVALSPQVGQSWESDPVLQELRNAAILVWAAAGIGPVSISQLDDVRIEWTDMPLDLLGMAMPDRGLVLIDRDAAGQGWFIDPLDPLCVEVVPGGVDLLSALLHEFGHLLGQEHADDESDLLFETLAPGQRRLPWSAAVDEALGED